MYDEKVTCAVWAVIKAPAGSQRPNTHYLVHRKCKIIRVTPSLYPWTKASHPWKYWFQIMLCIWQKIWTKPLWTLFRRKLTLGNLHWGSWVFTLSLSGSILHRAKRLERERGLHAFLLILDCILSQMIFILDIKYFIYYSLFIHSTDIIHSSAEKKHAFRIPSTQHYFEYLRQAPMGVR